jgi:uncharacterized protein
MGGLHPVLDALRLVLWRYCRGHFLGRVALAYGQRAARAVGRRVRPQRRKAGWVVILWRRHAGYVDLLAQEPTFNSRDIADCLANTNRFGGSVECSVGAHSLVVAALIARSVTRDGGSVDWYDGYIAGLTHDAHEAYLGDLPTPIKHLLPDYIYMCDDVQRKIDKWLGINRRPLEKLIKRADALALAWERRIYDVDTVSAGGAATLWGGVGVADEVPTWARAIYAQDKDAVAERIRAALDRYSPAKSSSTGSA